MTITSILTILQYALAPFLWLIIIAAAALILVQVVARMGGYRFTRHDSKPAVVLAILAGLSGLVWIPWFTHSRLTYVTTVFDWVMLSAALVGLAIAALLMFHPLSYLIRR